MSISRTTSSAPAESRCAGARTRVPRPRRRSGVCCIASSMARNERTTRRAAHQRRYGAQKPAQQGRTALSTTARDIGSAPARTRSNVLLVDDDRAFIDLARPALEAAGFSVSTASTGEPALEMLTHLRPDVVIADVPADETDGFELLRRLRSVPAGQAVPVILLTDTDADILTGLRLGADDCVARPLSPAELVARVSAKTSRPPVPADLLSRDLRTGLLEEETLLDEADRELARAQGSGAPALSGWSGSRSVPRSWRGSGPAYRFSWPSSWRTCFATTRCPWSGWAATARDTCWCCCRRHAALMSSSGWPSWPQRSPRPASPSTASRCGSPRSPPGPGPRRGPVAGAGLYEAGPDGALRASGHLDLLPVRWNPDLDRQVATERPGATGPRAGRAARPAELARADPGDVRPRRRRAAGRVRRPRGGRHRRDRRGVLVRARRPAPHRRARSGSRASWRWTRRSRRTSRPRRTRRPAR